MPTTFSFDAMRRFAGDRGFLDPGALVRDTLSRTLGVSGDRQPPSSQPFAATRARTVRDGAVSRGLPSALNEMLDRLSALKPGAPLCETTSPGRAQPTVVVPEDASFEERVFRRDTGSLAYRLYVPSTADGLAMPLVVMLHGCTQSA